MERFELTGDLLTNISDIDDQHRMLFTLANQVVDPENVDQGGAFFIEVIGFLAGYVDFHFAAEEMVMRDARYPRYQNHHHWHDMFRSEVDGILEAARSSGINKALKLRISFAIENWLTNHIRINDHELAEFLLRKSGLHRVELPTAQQLKAAGVIAETFEGRTPSDLRLGRG